jgi:hypothetical protein
VLCSFLERQRVVLWYFPEHKIAIISITYVHRSVSQHIEKSLK